MKKRDTEQINLSIYKTNENLRYCKFCKNNKQLDITYKINLFYTYILCNKTLGSIPFEEKSIPKKCHIN